MVDTFTASPTNAQQPGPKQKRRWPLAVACGVVGLVGGVVATSALATAPKDTTEYKAVVSQNSTVSGQLSDTKAQLATTSGTLTQTQSDLQAAQHRVDTLTGTITRLKGDLPRREAAVKKAEGAVAKREKAVAADRRAVSARETAVAKREKAVGLVETTIQNNTVSDGVYEVGTDIKAGTYKTDGGSGCYYAVLGSANTNNIINNSFQDGPAVVSVSDGQYLELDCDGADWVLQQ
jgi:hypothetical protein